MFIKGEVRNGVKKVYLTFRVKKIKDGLVYLDDKCVVETDRPLSLGDKVILEGIMRREKGLLRIKASKLFAKGGKE